MEGSAFTPNMRDMEKEPYSKEEKRIAEYILKITDGVLGGGDDPVEFLISSHSSLLDSILQLCSGNSNRTHEPQTE